MKGSMSVKQEKLQLALRIDQEDHKHNPAAFTAGKFYVRNEYNLNQINSPEWIWI